MLNGSESNPDDADHDCLVSIFGKDVVLVVDDLSEVGDAVAMFTENMSSKTLFFGSQTILSDFLVTVYYYFVIITRSIGSIGRKN